MARSLRPPGKEPEGSFTTPGGTRFTVRTTADGVWQRMESGGQTSEYRVAYVIGSGSRASGSLIQIGDHFFQSPVCYYPTRHAYDLAPGYEKLSDPDFTRPVTDACLACHTGSHMEAISCERCHGPVAQHLQRPVPGSIVNPAKLPAGQRDAVCEQCHLAGAVRVLNPGKHFADFLPGRRLEEVFTIYTAAAPPAGGDFKVISHSEQLRLSACARASGGKLWCGTCHDPHNKPLAAAQFYRARCLSCHQGKLDRSHPAASNDCIGCHMPRREARDGGHSVFTDHRIARRPAPDGANPSDSDLIAWREPPPALARRNLALAYVNAGVERRSPPQIVRGYRMLTEIQTEFRDDVGVLNGLGTALLLAKQPAEARIAFQRVLALTPNDASAEQNVAMAWLAAGDLENSAAHLERTLALDPLLLPAATTLMSIYRKRGDTAKENGLAERMRGVLSGARKP